MGVFPIMPPFVGRADWLVGLIVWLSTELTMDMVIVLAYVVVGCVGAVGAGPPPGAPGVVVTTATLHNNWIAWPSLNSPIILVSTTSSSAHAIGTALFTCTRPARHEVVHTCAELVKSSKEQPGILAV